MLNEISQDVSPSSSLANALPVNSAGLPIVPWAHLMPSLIFFECFHCTTVFDYKFIVTLQKLSGNFLIAQNYGEIL